MRTELIKLTQLIEKGALPDLEKRIAQITKDSQRIDVKLEALLSKDSATSDKR